MQSFSGRLFVITLGALLLPSHAQAHAALITLGPVEAIEIHAGYDTGEAMRGAQIVVYAPDNPAQPWLTGTADDSGRFVFVPDGTPGRWAVQAREAGHGAMSYFIVEGGETTALLPAPAQYDPLQRLVMLASIVWGAIGTALYFRRPRQRERA
ncbi:hypothetical protein [Pelagibacterium limicola]|uniref:hypothetical protein n=1 Tax=Pelagibacterium limicola TaxID=2791022 RepID=UPI001A9A736D|nr:hypothetical protein [Pelagibacterium limicola]